MRVSVVSGGNRTRVVGTTLGQLHRPHLLEAWGSRFNVQLEQHLAVFRYRDVPGMLGRVGAGLGEAGHQHRLGRRRARRPEGGDDEATMLVTADAADPAAGHRRHRRRRRVRRRAAPSTSEMMAP